MVQDYRRFSSLQHSFQVTVSHALAKTGEEEPGRLNGVPPAGAPVTRKRSPTVMPALIEVVAGAAEQLKGSPYFKNLLDSPELMEGKITSIRLPDDAAGAFGQILYCVRTGEMQDDLQKLCKHKSDSPDGKIYYSKSAEMVKTIVLEKKFGLQALHNAACDNLLRALTYIHLTSADMTHIVEHCDPHDLLYRLGMQSLGVFINHIGWSRWRVENDGWYNAFVSGKPLYPDIVAEAVLTYKDFDYPSTAEGICHWHSHTTAAPCEPPRNEPEVDLTDVKVKVEADMAKVKVEPEADDEDMYEWSNVASDESLCDSDECIELRESLEELTV